MTERVLIEGMMPYRALNRLRREGICLKNVQKAQKNQIICTVDRKDIEKIFASYPNVCYNSDKYAPYTARILPPTGRRKGWDLLKKRAGLWLGGVLFLALAGVFVSYPFIWLVNQLGVLIAVATDATAITILAISPHIESSQAHII